jgi:hypothetical protein
MSGKVHLSIVTQCKEQEVFSTLQRFRSVFAEPAKNRPVSFSSIFQTAESAESSESAKKTFSPRDTMRSSIIGRTTGFPSCWKLAFPA